MTYEMDPISKLLSFAYAFAVFYGEMDNLILKGESKMVRRLGLHDTEQQNQLAHINSILLLLAACTYPYEKLIGYPSIIFGYDWVSNGMQSVAFTTFILMAVYCIQRRYVKRDRKYHSKQEEKSE